MAKRANKSQRDSESLTTQRASIVNIALNTLEVVSKRSVENESEFENGSKHFFHPVEDDFLTSHTPGLHRTKSLPASLSERRVIEIGLPIFRATRGSPKRLQADKGDDDALHPETTEESNSSSPSSDLSFGCITEKGSSSAFPELDEIFKNLSHRSKEFVRAPLRSAPHSLEEGQACDTASAYHVQRDSNEHISSKHQYVTFDELFLGSFKDKEPCTRHTAHETVTDTSFTEAGSRQLQEQTETLSLARNALEGKTCRLLSDTGKGTMPLARKDTSVPEHRVAKTSLVSASKGKKGLPRQVPGEPRSSKTVLRTSPDGPSERGSLPIASKKSADSPSTESGKSTSFSDRKEQSLPSWERKETLPTSSNLLEGQKSSLHFNAETGLMPPLRSDTTEPDQVAPQNVFLSTSKSKTPYPHRILSEITASIITTSTDSSSQSRSQPIESREFLDKSSDSKHEDPLARKEASLSSLEKTERLSTASKLLDEPTRFLQYDKEIGSMPPLQRDATDLVSSKPEQVAQQKSLFPTSKQKKEFPSHSLSESQTSTYVTRTSTDSPCQSRSQPVVSREFQDGPSADSGNNEEASFSSWEQTESSSTASNLLEGQTKFLQYNTKTGSMCLLQRDATDQVSSKPENVAPQKSLLPTSKQKKEFPRHSSSESHTSTSVTRTSTHSPSQTGSLPILLQKSEGSSSADSEDSEHVSTGNERTLSLKPTETLSTASNLLNGQASSSQLNTEGSIPILTKDKTAQVPPSISDQVVPQELLFPTSKESKAFPNRMLSETGTSTTMERTFTESPSQTKSLPVVLRKSADMLPSNSLESEYLSDGKRESLSLWEQKESLPTTSNILEGKTMSLQYDTETESMPSLRRDATDQVSSKPEQVVPQELLLPSPKQKKAFPSHSLSESEISTSVTTDPDSPSQTGSLPILLRKSKGISLEDSKECRDVSAGEEESSSFLEPTERFSSESNLEEGEARSPQFETERRFAASRRDTAEQVLFQFEQEVHRKSLLPTSKETKACQRQSLSESETSASVTRTATDSPSQLRSQPIVSREYLDRSSADSGKHEDLLAGKEASLSSWEQTQTLSTESNLLEGQALSLQFDTTRRSISSLRRDTSEQVPFQFEEVAQQKSFLPTSKEKESFPRQSLSESQTSTSVRRTSTDSPCQSRSQPIVSREFLDRFSADSGNNEEASLSSWEQTESLSTASNLLEGQTKFLQYDTETGSMALLQRDSTDQVSSKPEHVGPENSLLPTSKEKKEFPRQSSSESQTLASVTRTSTHGASQTGSLPILLQKSERSSSEHVSAGNEETLSLLEPTETLSTASNLLERQASSLQVNTEGSIPILRKDKTAQVPTSISDQVVPQKLLFPTSKESKAFPNRTLSETETSTTMERTFTESPSQTRSLPIVLRKSADMLPSNSLESEYLSDGKRESLLLWEQKESLPSASNILERKTIFLQYDTETGSMPSLRRDATDQVSSKPKQVARQELLLPSPKQKKAFPSHSLNESEISTSVTTDPDSPSQTGSLPNLLRKSEGIPLEDSKESRHVSRRDTTEQVLFQFEQEVHRKSLLHTSKETKACQRQSLSESETSASVTRTATDSPSQLRSQPIVSREYLDRSSADSGKHEDLLAGKEASLSSWEQTQTLSTESNLLEGQALSLQFDTTRRSISSLRRDTSEQVPFQFEEVAQQKSFLPTSKEKKAFPRQSLSESQTSTSPTRTSTDSPCQSRSQPIVSRELLDRSSADSGNNEEASLSSWEQTESSPTASNLLEGQANFLQYDTESGSMSPLQRDATDQVSSKPEHVAPQKLLLPKSKEKKKFQRQSSSESEISTSLTTGSDSPSQTGSLPILLRKSEGISLEDSKESRHVSAGEEESFSLLEPTKTLSTASNLLERETSSLQFNTEGSIPILRKDRTAQVPTSISDQVVPQKLLFPTSKESKAFPNRTLSETGTSTTMERTFTESPSQTKSLPVVLRKSADMLPSNSLESEYLSDGKRESLSLWEQKESLPSASNILEGKTISVRYDTETGSMPSLRRDATDQVSSKLEQVVPQKLLLPSLKEKKAFPGQSLSESGISTSVRKTSTESPSQTGSLPFVLRKSERISLGDSKELKRVSAGGEESFSSLEPTETKLTESKVVEGQASSLQFETERRLTASLQRDISEQVPFQFKNVARQKSLLTTSKEKKAFSHQFSSESQISTSVTRTSTDSPYQSRSQPIVSREFLDRSSADSGKYKEASLSSWEQTESLSTASNLFEGHARSLQCETERRSMASLRRGTAEQALFQFEQEDQEKSLLPTSKEKNGFQRLSPCEIQTSTYVTSSSTDSPSKLRLQPIVSREFLDRLSADSGKHGDLLPRKEASVSSLEQTERLSTASNLLEEQRRFSQYDREIGLMPSLRRDATDQVSSKPEQVATQKLLLPTPKEKKEFPRQSLSESKISTSAMRTSTESPSQTRSLPVVFRKSEGISFGDSKEFKHVSAGKEESFSILEPTETLSTASNLLEGETCSLQFDTARRSITSLRRDTAEEVPFQFDQEVQQKSLLPTSKENKPFQRQSCCESQTSASVTRTSTESPLGSQPIVSREFLDRSSADSGKNENLLAGKEASLSHWEQTEILSTASNSLERQSCSIQFATETGLIAASGRDTTEQIPSRSEQRVPTELLFPSSKDSGSYSQRNLSESETLSPVIRTSKRDTAEHVLFQFEQVAHQKSLLPTSKEKKEFPPQYVSESENTASVTRTCTDSPSQTGSLSIISGKSEGISFEDSEESEHVSAGKEASLSLFEPTETLSTSSSLLEGQAPPLPLRGETIEQVPSNSEQLVPIKTLSPSSKGCRTVTRTSTADPSLPIVSKKSEETSSTNSEESEHVSTGEEESFTLWEQTETGSMTNLTGGSAGNMSLEYVLKESSLPTSLQSEDCSWNLIETVSSSITEGESSDSPPPEPKHTSAPADRSMSPFATESGSLLEEESLPFWQLTETGSFCLARVDSMETSASEDEHTSSTSGHRSPASSSTTSSDFFEEEAPPFWRMTEKG